MRKGLTASTVKTYDFAWCTFAFFCVTINVPLKPVSINSICAFICYCHDTRHFKLQYIRGLLAGIQFNIRCYDPSFSSLFSNQAIKLILKGISKAHPSAPDLRLPITLRVLQTLVSTLRAGVFSSYIDALLESVFSLAFYAFLRCGEFTTPSKSFNPSADITFSDLAFHTHHYDLHLKHSKCRGACSIVVAHLKLVLIKAKLSLHYYTGHSFRIGAATTAANQGISCTQLGRWSSSAFSSYIRPDVSDILANQRSLKP